jgi:hypothetical protein
MVHIHHGVLFGHKEEWNYVLHKKMDETGDLVKDWEWEISCFLSDKEYRPKLKINKYKRENILGEQPAGGGGQKKTVMGVCEYDHSTLCLYENRMM